MTKIILNKVERAKDEKKNRKLWMSRSKQKSKFQNGVMNLSKKFVKDLKKSGNNK